MRAVVCALIVGAWGCIVPAPGADGGSDSVSAPPLMLTSGAVFGDRVELVRGVVSPGRVKAGEPFQMTLVFRVLAPFDDDFDVFVHVEDADGRAERRNADHAPLKGTRPTRSWRSGETLMDEFTAEVPPGAQRALSIWLGLWQPQRNVRVPISNPERVRNDGQDRLWLGQVPLIK